jgi:SAM-dependent methyltransferase
MKRSELLSRLRKDPLGLVGRAIQKMVIGPLLYRRKSGYDAERYWRDRFQRRGRSLKAVGHEGLSEEENERMYSLASRTFMEVCAREQIAFAAARVLEIGCGSGFYTRLLHGAGVRSYTGVDITDVFFPELRREFRRFTFLKKDVTAERIEGPFDLVVMIDVTEHIVEEEKLAFALETIGNCLSDNGVLLLAQPSQDLGEKNLFYLRFWSLHDIERNMPGFIFAEPVPFRMGYLVSIRKTKRSAGTPR